MMDGKEEVSFPILSDHNAVKSGHGTVVTSGQEDVCSQIVQTVIKCFGYGKVQSFFVSSLNAHQAVCAEILSAVSGIDDHNFDPVRNIPGRGTVH